MLLVLLLMFTVMPAMELYLLFAIADVWGGMNTVALVLLTGVVGAYLAKGQGRLVISRIQSEVALGKIPADGLIQGLFIFAGGLLLVTPGVVTDIIGFSFVIPGTRHVYALAIKKWIEKKIKDGSFKVQTFGQNAGGFHVHYHSTNFEGGNPFEQQQRDVTPTAIKDVNSKPEES